jgi:hypothetical protein
MKSQCCKAEIEVVKPAQETNTIFGLTTGALVCKKCGKFCCRDFKLTKKVIAGVDFSESINSLNKINLKPTKDKESK